MGINNILVREYLETLKEDDELDYLFPILLNLMGYRIVTTAKEAKGQSQYGKDIVATYNGFRYYFELKGHSDKDITVSSYSKNDGIRESIIEAKDTAYNDSSIPDFNNLPIKIVLVHNGTIKANVKRTFDDFIQKEFADGEFERWDIYYLTDLFSEYLFNEYLLRDDESLKLFKKSLVLLDAPENDFRDFRKLVDLQINEIGKTKGGRSFNKFFATQNLLATIIFHYSREAQNLEPAKKCLTYLLLKTWAWVLENHLESKTAIKREVRKLVSIHFEMLDAYFKKTLPVAQLENGLFSEYGAFFEQIGYPLRCFDYLNYLIYYFEARLNFPRFDKTPSKIKKKSIRAKQKEVLKALINNNPGCSRPVLDSHLIAIVNVVSFLLNGDDVSEDDIHFIGDYLYQLMDNVYVINLITSRVPHVGDEESYVKMVSKEKKFDGKGQPPSLLIPILFEISAATKFEQFYNDFKKRIGSKVNLQTAYAKFDEYDIEQKLFEKHFDDEFFVETSLELDDSLMDFRKKMKAKDFESIEFRTDQAGFPYLRTLAHIYFNNEFFAEKWRLLY